MLDLDHQASPGPQGSLRSLQGSLVWKLEHRSSDAEEMQSGGMSTDLLEVFEESGTESVVIHLDSAKALGDEL